MKKFTSNIKMIEFLIIQPDGQWFKFPDNESPYSTHTIPFRVVEGSTGCIEIEGSFLDISIEDPGIAISIEGSISPEKAMSYVEDIRKHIEITCRQRATIIQIPPNTVIKF